MIILGNKLISQKVHTFHRDVLDGKAQNDGPDHTKSHLHVTVNDFFKENKIHTNKIEC